ncbi:unnamed protein product [Paramecium sonneborni]|nr:unnamed protein product [Paramecium sonneborni]
MKINNIITDQIIANIFQLLNLVEITFLKKIKLLIDKKCQKNKAMEVFGNVFKVHDHKNKQNTTLKIKKKQKKILQSSSH